MNSRGTLTTKPLHRFLLILLSFLKKRTAGLKVGDLESHQQYLLLYHIICIRYDLSCFLNCVYLNFFSPGDFIFLQERSCAFFPQLHIKVRCDLFSWSSITSLLESRLLQLIHCILGAVKYNGLAQKNICVIE